MMQGGFDKTGWHWTRKGWKRIPKHVQQVKKVPLPKKRKHAKKVMVKPAAPKASKSALRKPHLVPAPTPAFTMKTLPTADYSELEAVTERLTRPPSRRRSIHPPWAKQKPQPTAAPVPVKRVWNGKYDDLGKSRGKEAE